MTFFILIQIWPMEWHCSFKTCATLRKLNETKSRNQRCYLLFVYARYDACYLASSMFQLFSALISVSMLLFSRDWMTRASYFRVGSILYAWSDAWDRFMQVLTRFAVNLESYGSEPCLLLEICLMILSSDLGVPAVEDLLHSNDDLRLYEIIFR